MADLRERVEEDRGLIKQIQLAIPGFRGYRKREDLRIADSLLRIQLADRLRDDVGKPIDQTRELAARALELPVMNDIGTLVQALKTLEAKIRHAEQGYSGINPNYRIDEDKLHTLYEYDLSMIEYVNNLGDTAQRILSEAEMGDFKAVSPACREAKSKVIEFNNVFKNRHSVMADLGAF
jgi:hypothetical protein